MPGSFAYRRVFSSTVTRRWFFSGNLLALFSLLSLVLMSLASCASNASGKIPLTMWYYNGGVDDNVVARVNQAFPNIDLTAVKVNDYENKVRTALAGHSGIPDILFVTSDVANYYPDEDQFLDLRTVGADDIKSEYLPWKWNLGVAPDGRVIALPTDTGPTALFYRADIFAKAGLPTDPAQVAASIKTWDDYLQAAVTLKNATHGSSYLIDNAQTVFIQMLAQSRTQFLTPSGKYVADQQYMKTIWDMTAKAVKLGADAKVQVRTPAWNEAVSNGYIAGFVGAAWMKQLVQTAGPNTAGQWRVAAAPGGPGNYGGSFLGVTAATQHPKEAFEVAKWIESPANQLVAYQDIHIYPSTYAALDSAVANQNESFYGGQDTTSVFAAAAKVIPTFYESPYDRAINTAFTDQVDLMDFQGKDPTQAWNDAQRLAQRELLR
ncbi:MAG TPA: extracellular solute-binding protein [Ktedonobacteraceae bacterium]|jgi:cellobiose transport system substrate-binding protein|nr:extracellular solute-binding protein [Ktedonobacteraceae bacterium]